MGHYGIQTEQGPDIVVRVRMPLAFRLWAVSYLQEIGQPVTVDAVHQLFQRCIDELFSREQEQRGDDPSSCDPGGGMIFGGDDTYFV